MIATPSLAKIHAAQHVRTDATRSAMIQRFWAGDTIAEFHAGPIVWVPYTRIRLRRPASIVPRAQRPARTLRIRRATRIAQRLQDERADRMRLLARYAEERGITAHLEAPGQYAVRDPKQPESCSSPPSSPAPARRSASGAGANTNRSSREPRD